MTLEKEETLREKDLREKRGRKRDEIEIPQ
jgi:hypothetical protein